MMSEDMDTDAYKGATHFVLRDCTSYAAYMHMVEFIVLEREFCSQAESSVKMRLRIVRIQ